jgi:beta-xylosidase
MCRRPIFRSSFLLFVLLFATIGRASPWVADLRYHNGEFYIFYPDPGYGIYMTKASRPSGPWSAPLLIKQVKGWIDPCPFWDDASRTSIGSASSSHTFTIAGQEVI